MKPLSELLATRPSVHDAAFRDTVLDLKDLQGSNIDPANFFAENFVTDGMRDLLTQAFKRLEGRSDQGVFLLRQAMGGGKTHNLLTLGLLAQYPAVRGQVMGHLYQVAPELGKVKVVSFSGRETAPLGIWGTIAEQLGKKEFFGSYYAPLQAPGQSAWENLFDGETVLILLDELPPYFENAYSLQIGDSNLARVTATALSNLLVALGSHKCARVALVMTDLTAAYAQGRELIQQVLADFQNESSRLAKSIVPVQMNSNELYQILRVRLFEGMPPPEEIEEVCQGYAAAVRAAGQMDLVAETPESFAAQVRESFPFHPALRDLYARFKENEGFQQTRGLIRLMRLLVDTLWQRGAHRQQSLIAPYDLDLNHSDTVTTITGINSSLTNAIAHDVASGGGAVAEKLDAELGTTDATDAARLLLVSSLSTAMQQVRGLALPEIALILCRPGRDIKNLRAAVLEKLAAEAWYLHGTNDGKLYFQNVQNLNARLNDLVRGFQPEQVIREIRSKLAQLFTPRIKDCYQRILALPAPNEIELLADEVTLVIAEPQTGGLNPALRTYFDDTPYQNRVFFLTGLKDTYTALLDAGKRMKAIETVLAELAAENVTQTDLRMVRALELKDKIEANFYQAIRDTFTVLYYPGGSGKAGSEALRTGDFLMNFTSNSYDGEKQIREMLRDKLKFTEDLGDNFRKMVEKLLFTAQVTTWSEIKRRAATRPDWPWHHPRALDNLRNDLIKREVWRLEGEYLDKGPFAAPKTAVEVNLLRRDDSTGEATLKVIARYADTVYYEFGGPATPASARLEGDKLITSSLEVQFLAVDSTGQHETGDPAIWRNTLTLRHRIYSKGSEQWMELEALPNGDILYTTDGSSPLTSGATYQGEFALPATARFVLAVARSRGLQSEVRRFEVQAADKWVLDPARPATLNRKQSLGDTAATYQFLETAHKHQAQLRGIELNLSTAGNSNDWISFATSEHRSLSASQLQQALDTLRALNPEARIALEVQKLGFEQGLQLQDWAAETRLALSEKEVAQSGSKG